MAGKLKHCGLTALVYCGSAIAQTPDQPLAPVQADVPDTDIIVTAQRREERLQEVPISITVYNQAQINNRNIVSGEDLARFTPSLSANPRFGNNNTSFAIRGFTQELRTAPSVGVYFGEVVSPRAPASVTAGDGPSSGAFFDLQNVQVLKGPQGTLFGRNTTGGAVLLVPQAPTDRFEGYAEGSYGNLDYRRLQGVLNVPLGDNAGVRLGGDRLKREGFLRNISGTGPDRLGDRDYLALRASLLVDLTPGLQTYFIASYSRSRERGSIPQLQDCTGSFPFGLLSCQQIARRLGRGDYAVQSFTADPKSNNTSWQIINHTKWQISDEITIRNIASYSELRNYLRFDNFGTDWVIPQAFGPIANTGPLAGSRLTFAGTYHPPGRPTASSATFTEELQVQAQMGSVEWQAGGYFEETSPNGDVGSLAPLVIGCSDIGNLRCVDSLGALIRRPGTGSVSYQIGRQSFRTIGLYGQGSIPITDMLKLTGGIRYTWDKTRASVVSANYRFFTPNVPTVFCNFPGVGPGFGRPLPTLSPEPCRSNVATRTSAPTWVTGLDWTPDQDLLVYLKYSRGYRQGSANPFVPAPFQTFDKEKVDTYEGGLKASFRGAIQGTLGVAGFYNDFTNQQLTVGAISSTNAATPTQIVVNAGKSRIYGAEVETSLTLFTGFNVNASYAYLNTRLNSIVNLAPAPGSPFDILTPTSVVGQPLPLTPKHKLSGTAAYTLPLSDSVGKVTLSGTYTYTDRLLVVSTARGTLPSFGLWNANLGWTSVFGAPVDLSAFAVNLTKKRYFTYVNDLVGQGLVSRSLGEPRTYGLRLRYRFGS